MTTKKKIGIVTYWESKDNYGQQLQCWALQHFLREQGYDAFLIRQYVWPPVMSRKKGIKRIKQAVKDTVAAILYATNLAYRPSIYKRFSFCLDEEACRRQFPKFRKENLKMTKIYDSPEKLMQAPPKAEVYITGSDQVWNYTMPEGPLCNFFLQFGEESVKRISYAPSIGYTEFPCELKDKIKNYLQKFNAVSVRESTSIPMLQEIGYDATLVLDPTMLLPTTEYLKLSEKGKAKESVFIYSMNYASANDIPFEDIKQYANNQHLPIIVTPGSGYLPAKELFEGVEYCYATIPQWIQHIAHARLVVTASFHGIVFAILFHRPFIYTPLNGEHAGSNNRALNLLNNLNLNQRIYKPHTAFEDSMLTTINWKEVDDRLKKLRHNSLDYLLTAIES